MRLPLRACTPTAAAGGTLKSTYTTTNYNIHWVAIKARISTSYLGCEASAPAVVTRRVVRSTLHPSLARNRSCISSALSGMPVGVRLDVDQLAGASSGDR